MSTVEVTVWSTVALTALIWVFYLAIYEAWNCMMVSRVKNQAGNIKALSDNEQKASWKEYSSRLDSMVLMGSIFIAGTFVLLGASATASLSTLRAPLAVIASLSYLVWLFTNQLPTRIMNDVEAEIRLNCDSAKKVQEIQRELYGAKHGNSFMMKIRRNYWLAYVPIIVGVSIYLILT